MKKNILYHKGFYFPGLLSIPEALKKFVINSQRTLVWWSEALTRILIQKK